MPEEERKCITFHINGKPYTVRNEYPPSTTLLEYLRMTGISTGTKGCCLEGGCGVCVVTIKYNDPLSQKPKTYSVTSCCLALYSCDGLDITTIEGLGNTRDGLHPIQDRLAKYDGVQCGYCSPGQVMCMYGLLQNGKSITMKEVEDAFDTTICRCTGYRSILDAMKSFAVDSPMSENGSGPIDIEDLDGKICRKNRLSCSSHHEISNKPVKIVKDGCEWYRPTKLHELIKLIKLHASEKYRLVSGNTGFGLFKELSLENFRIFIDTRGVKELNFVDLNESVHISIGANLTLTNLKELFESMDDPGVVYSKEFANHIQYVSSAGVRNLASWAGNLMLKHAHPSFESDIFTLLETVGAIVNIVDIGGRTKGFTLPEFLSTDMGGRTKSFTLPEFLSTDMKGKIIVSMQLPKYRCDKVVIRAFRTSSRLQNSTSYVVSGFNFKIDESEDYLVEGKPTIVIQGISAALIHASQTEAFLANKKLANPSVLKEALRILSSELEAEPSSPPAASPAYRTSLAVGHFYKFVLGVCKDKVNSRYVSGGLDLERPVMTATHEYGTINEKTFPVSKPTMKITAPNLTTGEVRFVSDQPAVQGQLYAAPTLSSVGNARIASIDSSAALALPGVVAVLQASDIPGMNNWRPKSVYGPQQSEVLSSGQVLYAGQTVAVVVAESESRAQEAAQLVKIHYTDTKPVIVDVMDAIKQKAFLDKLGPYTRGEPQAALESAPNRIKGSTRSQQQYHFHLENQAAICTPTDLGGMDVLCTTQWVDATQESVAQVLGIPEASVVVETQRMGGAFGSKILYNLPVSTMAAIAAHKLGKPVKLSLDLQTNMQYQGNREGYFYEYEIGFDNDGKLLAVVATGYGDSGPAMYGENDEHTYAFVESAYYCPNFSWTIQACRTNRPTITFMRAPGSASAIFAMESMMDHVATYLKKDHLEVRKINLCENGHKTLGNLKLEHVLMKEVIQELESDINYTERKKQVEDFNKAHRWRKRGLHVMPSRYTMMYTTLRYDTSVAIYHGDASVIISHGGTDMGQGINTKAIQCCSYKLGVPIDKIKVATSSSVTSPNSAFTGGSTTAELICSGVLKCCEELNKRLEATKQALENPVWEEIISKAFNDGVNLHAQHWPETPLDNYCCYTACSAEVELDILTGQYHIVQVDYVYDGGISLSPALDLGQLEGGFIMGCGLFLLEHMDLDPATSKALTDGTTTYKPPLGKNLPCKLNVKFMRNVPNTIGILSSKTVGETPVAHGSTPLFALKRAVEAARVELGLEGWFHFDAPATVEKIQLACLNDITKYTLGD